MRHSQETLGFEEAANFLHLQDHAIGGAPLSDLLQVVQLLCSLVGVQGRFDPLAQAGHALDIPVWQRLLDEVESMRIQPADRAQGLLVVPRTVGIEADACTIAKRLADGCSRRHVVVKRAAPHFQLEGGEAGFPRGQGGLGDLHWFTRRKHPPQRRRFACTTPEQLINRHTERFAFQVMQGAVDQPLGLVVVACQRVHRADGLLDVAWILAEQDARGEDVADHADH
ncbi:hypothetical protein D3C72_1363910 [compost metagenome]